MRNAAMFLGVIAGLIAMIIGFVSYGYITAVETWGEVDGMIKQVENQDLVRAMSLLAPMLAIAGGAMARSRALWGGILLILSAGGMYYAFGFNVFTMFPIAFAGTGGLLAVAAGKPDEEKAHF